MEERAASKEWLLSHNTRWLGLNVLEGGGQGNRNFAKGGQHTSEIYTTWSMGAGVFIHRLPAVTVGLIYRRVNYLPFPLSLFQKKPLGREMAQQLDIIQEHPKHRQGTDSVCYCYTHLSSFSFLLSLCNILNNRNTYFINISYSTLNFFYPINLQWFSSV